MGLTNKQPHRRMALALLVTTVVAGTALDPITLAQAPGNGTLSPISQIDDTTDRHGERGRAARKVQLDRRAERQDVEERDETVREGQLGHTLPRARAEPGQLRCGRRRYRCRRVGHSPLEP